MRSRTGRRSREVAAAQSEYRMTMLMLVACVVMVVLFAGAILQSTAATVSNRLAHVTDHDYQVSAGKLFQ